MHNRYYPYLTYLIAVSFLTACGLHHQPDDKNSPLLDNTTLYIEQLSETDTAQAFRLLDSLFNAGKMEEHTYWYTRASIHRDNNLFLAISEIKQAYLTPIVQADDTMHARVLHRMAHTMLPNGNHEECVRYAIEGIQLARKIDRPVLAADFTMLIGMSYYDMGEKQRAWEKMNDAMQQIRSVKPEDLNNRRREKMSMMALSCATAHINDQNMPGAIQSCHLALQVLEPMPPTAADPIRGQAYAKLAGAYAKLQVNDSADYYADRYQQTAYGKKDQGKRLNTYYKFRGKYAEGLDVMERCLANTQGRIDTISALYISLLRECEDYYIALGNSAAAYRMAHRAAVLADSLHARDIRQEALEAAERFDAQERAHHKAITRRNELIFISVFIFLVLLIIIGIVYNLHIRQKKRSLLRVIHALEQKHKVMEEAATPQPDTNSEDNARKYMEMEHVIEQQKAYLDPMANIDAVMEKAGYSRYLSTLLIQKYAGANTRVDYLNQKRIDYAANLLISEPELSIREVARRSGFYEESTFRRNFKKYLGLTPAAFRDSHFDNQNE